MDVYSEGPSSNVKYTIPRPVGLSLFNLPPPGFLGVALATTTVLSTIDLLPVLSVALYTTLYVPALSVLTLLSVLSTISLSQLSVTLAPSSLYLEPTCILILALPFNVIFGFSVSSTVTLISSLASLPDESLTLTYNILSFNSVVTLSDISPSKLSIALYSRLFVLPLGHTFKLEA